MKTQKQGTLTDAVRCLWCGKPGTQDWHVYRRSSRIAAYRACEPICFNALQNFIKEDVGRILFETYHLAPLAHCQVFAHERKAEMKKQAVEAKSKKTAMSVSITPAQLAAEIKKTLKTAQVITGKNHLPKQAELLGKWLLYQKVEFKKGQFSEYAVCTVVELNKAGTAPTSDPFKAIISGTVLIRVLHDHPVPFIARVEKGTNSFGKDYYYYV